MNEKGKALGLDDLSTFDMVNNLGSLCHSQDKLAEAEQLYDRALKGKEKILGSDHPSTLMTVNSLGLIYRDQGKLAESENMFQRVLEGRKNVLGPHHSLTLEAISNLGTLYVDQGRLDMAKEMFQVALEGFEKVFGLHHNSTLDVCNNLGEVYRNQGKLIEAEDMYQRALKGYETDLDHDHMSILGTLNNLGLLYCTQGKLAKAEEMYQRALKGNEKIWGPDHRSTLMNVDNLGILYFNQGRLAEAEEMFQRALKGYEKASGSEDRLKLDAVNNLGLLYCNQGRLVEAEEVYDRALKGKEKILGPDHPSTLETVRNMAVLYQHLNENERAVRMYERALEGKRRTLGSEHPSSLQMAFDLASFYETIDEFDKARTIFQHVAVEYQQIWGLHHTKTQEVKDRLRLIKDSRHLNEQHSTTTSSSGSSTRSASLAHEALIGDPSNISGSHVPEAEGKPFIEKFISIMIGHDDIRTTLIEATRISKYEVKANQHGIERKIGRLLRLYAYELQTSSINVLQKDISTCLLRHIQIVAAGVLQAVLPNAEWRRRMNNLQEQRPEENLMHTWLVEGPTQQTQQNMPGIGFETRNETRAEIDRKSNNDSEASQPVEHETGSSKEMIEPFLFSGQPFANLKESIREYVAHERHMTAVPERLNPQNYTQSERSLKTENNFNGNQPNKFIRTAISSLESLLVQLQFWFQLAVRPSPQPGYTRITWTCGCGKPMFDDVKETRDGAAQILQSVLRQSAARASQSSSGQPDSGVPTGARPSLNTNTQSMHTGEHSSITQHTSYGLSNPSLSSSVSSESASPSGIANVQFLLLCINTRRSKKSLEHIEIYPSTNDQQLFESISQRYSQVRRLHDWKISMLVPTWAHAPDWLINFLEHFTVSVPKSANYVKFHLVPVHTEITPANLKHPSLPPESEVRENKYHYSPCPSGIDDHLLSNQFIHELLSPGEHLDRYWTESIPKKLNQKLVYISGQRPFGWGIDIIESLNWYALSLVVLTVVVISGVISLTYSIVAKDVSSGFAIGAYIMAVLTLGITLQYFTWEKT